jgi:hypothetical protein
LERSERKWSQPEILLRKKLEKWAEILLRNKMEKWVKEDRSSQSEPGTERRRYGLDISNGVACLQKKGQLLHSRNVWL